MKKEPSNDNPGHFALLALNGSWPTRWFSNFIPKMASFKEAIGRLHARDQTSSKRALEKRG